MCLFAALGLLAPRLILLLMWLFNSTFVVQPFAGFAVPNPILPVLGLVMLPTTTLVLLGNIRFWRSVVVQRASRGCNRTDHRSGLDWQWPWRCTTLNVHR